MPQPFPVAGNADGFLPSVTLVAATHAPVLCKALKLENDSTFVAHKQYHLPRLFAHPHLTGCILVFMTAQLMAECLMIDAVNAALVCLHRRSHWASDAIIHD
jgi:hypothetical protein